MKTVAGIKHDETVGHLEAALRAPFARVDALRVVGDDKMGKK